MFLAFYLSHRGGRGRDCAEELQRRSELSRARDETQASGTI